MWYPKKLFLCIKSLNFIVFLAISSVAIAMDENSKLVEDQMSRGSVAIVADENTLLVQGTTQPILLTIHEEGHSEKFGFGKREFLNTQKKLIEGRQLNLWGVGLFSSNDAVGAVIRMLTASDWSHVGLILEDEKDHSLFCFESTGAAAQIFDGVLPQVQIASWQDVVDNYNGKIAQRQFKFSGQTPKWQDTLKYVNNNLGKSYEKDMSSLINAIRGENKKSDVSSVFCSEMVADCLIQSGYLDETIRLADNYVPGHFSSKQLLPWINGASLDKQIMVKGKTSSSCCTIM